MTFIHKRKKTTAKSLRQSLTRLGLGETWAYASNKLSMSDYHDVVHLSSHMIKDLANRSLSDYHIYRKYIKRDLEQVSSDKFIIGSAFHCAVLEPHLFDSEYAVQPKFDRRTKVGKEGAAKWDEQNKGKQALTEGEFELVEKMAGCVNSNKFAKALLKDTSKEVSAFTLEKGMVVKGRIDAVNIENRYGIDLKSAEDVSPAGFAKAAANFRYDLQAYTYKKLFGLNDFIFICCNKKDPMEVAIYTLNDDFMEKAEEDYNDALSRWQRIKVQGMRDSFVNDSEPMITLAPPSFFKYL